MPVAVAAANGNVCGVVGAAVVLLLLVVVVQWCVAVPAIAGGGAAVPAGSRCSVRCCSPFGCGCGGCCCC